MTEVTVSFKGAIVDGKKYIVEGSEKVEVKSRKVKVTPCCLAKPKTSHKTYLVGRKWVKAHKCPGCDREVLATALVKVDKSEQSK